MNQTHGRYTITQRRYGVWVLIDTQTENPEHPLEENVIYTTMSHLDCRKRLHTLQWEAAAANDAIVTADDIDSDRWHDAAEYAKDDNPLGLYWTVDTDIDGNTNDKTTFWYVMRPDGRVFAEVWDREMGDYPIKVYWVTACTFTGEETFKTLDDVRAAIDEAVRVETHDTECDGDACADIIVPDLSDIPFLEVDITDLDKHVPPITEESQEQAREELGWNARLAARAAAIVTAAGGLALALACLTGTPTSASERYHTGQSVIIAGSNCQVTHAWEDGSAVAHCRNHTVWTFDPDGSPTHAPQTWYRVKHTHNDHNSYGR